MRYNAFISYRHSDLDMEFAKKIHTGLETYHVPGPVRKKTGKKKIERVFRDQEELPIGSDLNDNISGALAQSEYLIVICSPRTPESYWVCKEIESFIKMHDREHILAVLIEGEPNESFPPQLLTDDKGNPVEPLAADVRGADKKEMNKKFKTEILRLAAPVLGCSYDDLRQRHKERIIKRTIGLVSAGAAVLALAGTAFGIYNAVVAKQMEQLANEKSQLAAEKSQLADEKTQLAEEILQEYKDKQKNQSRFYAEKSLSLLEAGYREDAVLVAKEGLPYEGNDRPYVAEAEYALSEALHAYDGETDYCYDRVLKHDVVIDTVKVDKDTKHVISLDRGSNLYVWNTDDWSMQARIPVEVSEENKTVDVVEFGPYEDGFGVIRQSGFTKYDYDGNEIFRIDAPNTVLSGAVSEAGNEAVICYAEPRDENESIFDWLGKETKYFSDVISCKDQKVAATYQLDDNPINNKRVSFTRDGSKVIVVNDATTLDMDQKSAEVSIYDIATGEIYRRNLSCKYLTLMAVTRGGNVCFLSSDEDFYVGNGDRYFKLDVFDGTCDKHVFTVDVAIDSYSYMYAAPIITSSSFKMDGKDFTGVDLVYGNTTFMYDAADGTLVSRTDMTGIAEGFVTYVDSNQALIAYSNGVMEYINLEAGTFFDNDLQTGKNLENLIACGYNIILVPYNSTELFVCNCHQAPDLEEIAATTKKEYTWKNSQKIDYLITMSYEDDSFNFYDTDGTLLYVYDDFDLVVPQAYGYSDNKFIYSDMDALRIIDPRNKNTDVYNWDDILDVQYFNADKSYITDNGKYIAVWDLSHICVLDLETMEKIYSWNYDYKVEDEQYADDVTVTEDGKKVILFREDGKLVYSDVDDPGFKSYGNDDIQALCGNVAIDKLALSSDGKMAAVFCIDEVVRVINVESGDTIRSFPVLAQNNLFMEFSEDNKYLALQGDDYILRIWNLDKNITTCELEMNGKVQYMVYDDEDGIVAVTTGRRTWLLETENFRTVATASNKTEISYVPKYNLLVYSNGKAIYKIKYKDYTQLLEEAERQFPGLELTEEKKRNYNID